ncbi:potassium channel family protein [Radiobacillus deserti]|uniref:Potassium channel family protein n=1 Tax=Radiobacillus deserti TaxID=2594883 RepID=A0A516KHT2_9BACI|nr:potassium channel protein [Radiobacillus deserti]QDP40949.1 potassium channel family protein [Radiobacillus deserti]
MNLQQLWHFYFRIPLLYRLFLTVIILMFLFGVLIHFVEPESFPTIFDGVWWAFVTGSTVGYGDYVPLSTIGRMMAILLILAGGGLVTFYMATVSAKTVNLEHDFSKGKVKYNGKAHIIFVGWNERTKQLLHQVQERHSEQSIVLIDQTLGSIPDQDYNIHFIRGDATEDETLRKANIKEANCVVITSDPSKNEREADQQSILTTVAIRGNNPNVTIITEILTKDQTINATRAGADSVIRSNDFMSTLFYHELFRDEPVEPFDLILELFSNQQFKEVELPKHLEGKTFLDTSDYLVASEQILVGIRRNGELIINPPFQKIIAAEDTLIVLSKLD